MSIVVMCSTCQVKRGGPLFVLHSGIHEAPPDRRTAGPGSGQRGPEDPGGCPLAPGGHPRARDEQPSAHSPTVAARDPVPVSVGTRIRDEQ